MNTDTGELRMFAANLKSEELEMMGFTPVPNDLHEEAERVLDGKESVMVDIAQNTPLANWTKRRQKSKKKVRAKIARKSRARNKR